MALVVEQHLEIGEAWWESLQQIKKEQSDFA